MTVLIVILVLVSAVILLGIFYEWVWRWRRHAPLLEYQVRPCELVKGDISNGHCIMCGVNCGHAYKADRALWLGNNFVGWIDSDGDLVLNGETGWICSWCLIRIRHGLFVWREMSNGSKLIGGNNGQKG